MFKLPCPPPLFTHTQGVHLAFLTTPPPFLLCHTGIRAASSPGNEERRMAAFAALDAEATETCQQGKNLALLIDNQG